VVFKNGISPLGLLRSCFQHALVHDTDVGGVFKAVRKEFSKDGDGKVLETVETVNEFRNTYVAHHNMELNDASVAKENLKRWASALNVISRA
jgi:type III restriction enzyme